MYVPKCVDFICCCCFFFSMQTKEEMTGTTNRWMKIDVSHTLLPWIEWKSRSSIFCLWSWEHCMHYEKNEWMWYAHNIITSKWSEYLTFEFVHIIQFRCLFSFVAYHPQYNMVALPKLKKDYHCSIFQLLNAIITIFPIYILFYFL